MSWGVGHRCGWDPVLLWLWCRPAATAPIRPLAWEPLYAMGAAPEKAKRQKIYNNNNNEAAMPLPPPPGFCDVHSCSRHLVSPHAVCLFCFDSFQPDFALGKSQGVVLNHGLWCRPQLVQTSEVVAWPCSAPVPPLSQGCCPRCLRTLSKVQPALRMPQGHGLFSQPLLSLGSCHTHSESLAHP